ncbi:MAG: hypothetical protein HYV59_08555 [Planctomycetes bacterium]|nr:hypothetical protein [Planctomycetota bacterium]
MAERTLKEKNIKKHLEEEGFKEIKVSDKHSQWYKKASESTSCLKRVQKK